MVKLSAAFMLAYAGWFGTLQSLPTAGTNADLLRVASVAGLLSTLTVFVYRLGVWRQEMENTKNNIGAEVKAYRAESSVNFERMERRLEVIDRVVTTAARRAARATRWQARTERRLTSIEDAQPMEGA